LPSNALDMAERRLERDERVIQLSPVAGPVPQSSQRIGTVDLILDGVERRAVRAFGAAPRLSCMVAPLKRARTRTRSSMAD
jgi:hypothetical protein